MKAWLAAHRYAARGALARFARHPVAALFEAAVIGVALALPLAFALAIENVRTLAAGHPATPELSVFLALDAAAPDVERIGERLRAIDGAQVRFVAKAEAEKRLRQSAALAEVLDALPENPLPDAYTVRLQGADGGRLATLQRDIAAWPGVARVQLDAEWAQKLEVLVRTGWAVAAALGATLAIAMVAVTFNTVRLQMLRAREEMELSRLIGATEAFVRRPYLYFGALQGLVGAFFALALVCALGFWVDAELDKLSETYGVQWNLQPLPGAVAGAVLGLGAALGWLAARLSAARTERARELRR